MKLLRFFALLLLVCSGCKQQTVLHLSNERFGEIEVVSNSTRPTRRILFFTDDSPEAQAIVATLSKEKFLIATIHTSAYLQHIKTDTDDCSYIGGEIERLSQTVQSEAKVESYDTPVLLGVGEGASLAFAALAEAPSPFKGAVTIGFCPTLPLPRPLCDGDALVSRLQDDKTTVSIGPSDILASEWIDFQFNTNTRCPNDSISTLIKKTPNAQLIPADSNAMDAVTDKGWKKQLLDAVQSTGHGSDVSDPNAPLPDLPLVVAAPKEITADYFVIFFSGDGGWAWIDKGITKVLNAHGVPVVGVNVFKYLWDKHSPNKIASDISRITKAYGKIFGKTKVSLMGYSLGSEVLPAAYNRLARGTRESVVSIGMVAPGVGTTFEVLIGDWLGVNEDEHQVPIAPELQKITSIPVACIAGDDDEETVCKGITQKNIRILLLPGGHHFDGDYEFVGNKILELLQAPHQPQQ